MDLKKVAHIGIGASYLIHEMIVKHLEKEDDLMIHADTNIDSLKDRLSPVFPIKPNPLIDTNYIGPKPKATCKKHHEYVEHTTKDGNIYHSSWICRHCGRNMKD